MIKLWDLIVKENKVNPNYMKIRNLSMNHPGRLMLDEIGAEFEDPDGNFLEQFQTTGFDSRYFELYLFAYFTRSGFTIDRAKPYPDFIVTRNGVRVAVEATTVNPSKSGALFEHGKEIKDLSPDNLAEYLKNELPVRFGGPVFSKLNKEYWNLPHCRRLPFVIAIEAFHDDEALAMSEAALTNYLFGLEYSGKYDKNGQLEIAESPLLEHKVGNKQVASGLFSQAESKNLSAILFTNSGTNAKFSRMGYQHGHGSDDFDIYRHGYCYNPDPDAMDPTLFSYDMNEPIAFEPWGQGLMVIHNPNATYPLPKDFFVDAAQQYRDEGTYTIYPGWHPIMSETIVFEVGDAKEYLSKLKLERRKLIAAIPKHVHQLATGIDSDGNPIAKEVGWFAEETDSFFGVVFRDIEDGDFGYSIFARNRQSTFVAIKVKHTIPSRDIARMELQLAISDYLKSPKRIF